MKSRYLILIILAGLFTSPGVAQNGSYSESASYTPRKEEAPKKKQKNKSADKKPQATPTPVPVAATGDVTVTIPFAVLDRNRMAIGDLAKDDVTVFVDDVEVPIVTFERDRQPPTVILVIDSSPSTQPAFESAKEQARKLVASLPEGMKVAVFDFSDRLNVRSQPTSDRAETLKAISKISMGDGTSIYSAIQFLYEQLLPQIVDRKVIVLMTDGVDTTSQKSTFAASLTEVEKNDTTVYPVYFDTSRAFRRPSPIDSWLDQIIASGGRTGSIAEEYDRGRSYLGDLAAASGGRMFSAGKFEEATKSLVSELANRYYATIAVPRKGPASRRIRLRVNRPSVAVLARGSFVEK